MEPLFLPIGKVFIYCFGGHFEEEEEARGINK